MKRKITGLTFSAVLFVLCSSAEAQESKNVVRIGYLGITPPSAMVARMGTLRQGLRELGYVDGKNIVIEWRYAVEGKLDQLPALAAELVRLKVDVIVTAGPTSTRAAKGQLPRFPLLWRPILTL